MDSSLDSSTLSSNGSRTPTRKSAADGVRKRLMLSTSYVSSDPEDSPCPKVNSHKTWKSSVDLHVCSQKWVSWKNKQQPRSLSYICLVRPTECFERSHMFQLHSTSEINYREYIFYDQSKYWHWQTFTLEHAQSD